MRRIASVAVPVALMLLGSGGAAKANGPYSLFGLGCGGTCLNLFPHIHQHGPLFNYGPYYGYPPFEPYGNWNAYLQYTGPAVGGHGGGGGGGNQYGWIHGGNPHTWGGGNPHPLHHGGGLFHHGHKGSTSTCTSCSTAAGTYLNSQAVTDRYTGVGSPAASAAYYADSPALNTAGVVPVGFPAR